MSISCISAHRVYKIGLTVGDAQAWWAVQVLPIALNVFGTDWASSGADAFKSTGNVRVEYARKS